MKIMKDEMLIIKFIYLKILLLVLAALFFVNKPMTAKAESISLGVIGFDDHRGMMAYINGKPVYQCQLVKNVENRINGLSIGIKGHFGMDPETNGVVKAIC